MKKHATNIFVKECIVTAIKQLMIEKEYEKITITEITKRAGVSRMAYYRNYTSKEDILQKALEDHAKNTDLYTIPLFESGDIEGYIEYLFYDFHCVSDFYKSIINARLGDMILKYFNHCTILFVSRYCDPQPLKYQILVFSGAVYNMAIQWILSGLKETPGQMAEIFLGAIDMGIINGISETAQKQKEIQSKE